MRRAAGHPRSLFLLVLFPCALMASGRATAAEDSAARPDKSAFTLFNPTPASMLREFNTDRPDVTEGPYSVDAGHLQIELSFLEFTRHDSQGVRTEGFSVLPTNFRLGIRNNLDLELIASPYQNVQTHGYGLSQRDTGVGDTELRVTLNLWGNDGGGSAFGVIPFVTLPTGSGDLGDHHLEGGLILPLEIKLPAGFDAGTEAKFDVARNDANDGYGMDFVHSLSVGHGLLRQGLSAYLEYVGVSPERLGRTYLAYVDTGITSALGESAQLDLGMNAQLPGHAGDFTLFAGFAIRI